MLSQPHQRATHLLELLGAPLAEGQDGGLLGPGFLMEVMEVREELEQMGSDMPRLRELRDANDASVGRIHAELVAAFDSRELEQARALTARLQYLQRIEEEIHAQMPLE